tara:strand:+ start:828 stop:956 length:129 start_codon:yes stop_codon:yes gene_type:complete
MMELFIALFLMVFIGILPILPYKRTYLRKNESECPYKVEPRK